jgi:starch synthase
MESKKVLFVSQEITPYLPETELSQISRFLPQAIQETGKEIRTFMPKYGNINERRNQLHEVIRLSGMNLIIDDTDHPLMIMRNIFSESIRLLIPAECISGTMTSA